MWLYLAPNNWISKLIGFSKTYRYVLWLALGAANIFVRGAYSPGWAAVSRHLVAVSLPTAWGGGNFKTIGCGQAGERAVQQQYAALLITHWQGRLCQSIGYRASCQLWLQSRHSLPHCKTPPGRRSKLVKLPYGQPWSDCSSNDLDIWKISHLSMKINVLCAYMDYPLFIQNILLFTEECLCDSPCAH